MTRGGSRLFFFLIAAPCCFAQAYLDNLPAAHPAIRYFEDQTIDDSVTRLARGIGAGRMSLEWTERFGYLPDLLRNLGINPDTQALVFSKTSFQATRISPHNPRAIYFNDEAAAGFVPGGTGLELAAVDPRQGVVLYSLNRGESGKPRFERKEVCLKCHQGPSTLGVPGIFIGSVFPNTDGVPARDGAIVTDHRTAFADRWGGWFVNAARGEQKDRANAAASGPAEPDVLDTRIDGQFDPANYLTKTSDIVALMTFEHQTQMVNFLTRLNWEARIGRGDEKTARQLERDIEAAADYMLFVDEAPLAEPVEGVSAFSKTFPERGPRDHKGRSLRDFDLHTRLFRYPLSYMIYSPQFEALPDGIRERIYRRLYAVLMDSKRGFPERLAVLEILADTKTGLPAWWKARGSTAR